MQRAQIIIEHIMTWPIIGAMAATEIVINIPTSLKQGES